MSQSNISVCNFGRLRKPYFRCTFNVGSKKKIKYLPCDLFEKNEAIDICESIQQQINELLISNSFHDFEIILNDIFENINFEKQQRYSLNSSSDYFEVEDILDYRKDGNKEFFLVKWKDFPLEGATWEPKSNVEHLYILLDNFFDKYNKRQVESSKEECKADDYNDDDESMQDSKENQHQNQNQWSMQLPPLSQLQFIPQTGLNVQLSKSQNEPVYSISKSSQIPILPPISKSFISILSPMNKL